MKRAYYGLSDGGCCDRVFSELFPVMDLTVLPMAGPILGISFSIFRAALRNPRVRSSIVTPLLRSACCGSEAASTLPISAHELTTPARQPIICCRDIKKL